MLRNDLLQAIYCKDIEYFSQNNYPKFINKSIKTTLLYVGALTWLCDDEQLHDWLKQRTHWRAVTVSSFQLFSPMGGLHRTICIQSEYLSLRGQCA